MRVLEVIESKRWFNRITGATASIYGSVPWVTDLEKYSWEIQTVGYTWRNSNGTIGLGRKPVKTREEAEEIMHKVNSLRGV